MNHATRTNRNANDNGSFDWDNNRDVFEGRLRFRDNASGLWGPCEDGSE
jgi:hypothetical protein